MKFIFCLGEWKLHYVILIKDFTLLWNSSGSSWFLQLTLFVPYYCRRKVGSCSNTKKYSLLL